MILRLFPIVLVTAAVCFAGCDPRQLPGFKEAAKREEERITKETEEAIKTSPALQELSRLCTEQIARPDEFVLVIKYRDVHEGRFLGYGYHSTLDYQRVKSFYIDYFAQHGWQLTKQKDGGWGPSEIEFRNNTYRVTIFDMGAGDRANYNVNCGKL